MEIRQIGMINRTFNQVANTANLLFKFNESIAAGNSLQLTTEI